MENSTIKHNEGVKSEPWAKTEDDFDIPPIDATPEELAKSMFRSADEKSEEKKRQK